MDGDLITAEGLINRVLFQLILISISCEYYSIMDKDLNIKLRFPRVKIQSKWITNFVKENTKEPGVEITEIVKFSIDIQGYRRNIFAYVVLILLNPVIISLLSIRENNIIIKPISNTLIINSYNLTILIKEIQILLKIKESIVTPFAILIKGVKKY